MVKLSIKKLRQICQPPSTSGHINMRMERKVSIYLTKLFISLGILPNSITYARFFVGLIGIALISFGHYKYVLAGSLIFQFSILLDLTDGEVFRYRNWKKGKRESFLVGGFLDKTFDHFYRPLLLIAAGIGA